MYSNNILNFQESMTILNAHPKKSLETYCMHHVYYIPYYRVFIQFCTEFKMYQQ